MLKKHANLFTGLILIVVGIVVSTQISSIKITKIASDARLMPKVVCALFFFLGSILVIQGLMNIRKVGIKCSKEDFDFPAMMRAAVCLIIFAAFIYFLPRAGFIVSGCVYLLLSTYQLAPKNNRNNVAIILTSIITPILIYVLFVYGFRLLLPAGTWWS